LLINKLGLHRDQVDKLRNLFRRANNRALYQSMRILLRGGSAALAVAEEGRFCLGMSAECVSFLGATCLTLPYPPNLGVCFVLEGEWSRTRGIPHLAKNERDTRISCTRPQVTAKCAAFIKESRMKLANAINIDRKSGDMAHPGSVVRTDPSLERSSQTRP
jgi:hypothetical protein